MQCDGGLPKTQDTYILLHGQKGTSINNTSYTSRIGHIIQGSITILHHIHRTLFCIESVTYIRVPHAQDNTFYVFWGTLWPNYIAKISWNHTNFLWQLAIMASFLIDDMLNVCDIYTVSKAYKTIKSPMLPSSWFWLYSTTIPGTVAGHVCLQFVIVYK